MMVCTMPKFSTHVVNFVDLNPKDKYFKERLAPMKDMKDIQIIPEFSNQNIRIYLMREEDNDIVRLLWENVDLFA